MNRRLAALVAIPAALLLAVPVLGHSVASPSCGAITFDSTKGWMAVLQPGDETFGPFATDGENGPFAIAAGTYTYQFVTAAGTDKEHGSITVAACASPSPSTPAPSPSPSSTPQPSLCCTHRGSLAGSPGPCISPIPTPPATATPDQAETLYPDGWSWVLIVLGGLASFVATCWRFTRRIARRP